jgi:hypothetical protein
VTAYLGRLKVEAGQLYVFSFASKEGKQMVRYDGDVTDHDQLATWVKDFTDVKPANEPKKTTSAQSTGYKTHKGGLPLARSGVRSDSVHLT